MAISEINTFLDIQNAIMRRGKISDTDANRVDIKEKINTYYQHLAFKRAYRWSGETYPLFLPKKYETGTIDVTEDSDIVTGTGTSWTQFDHEKCKMRISGDSTPYKILRVASTTSITLDSAYQGDTDTGLSYTIYKDEYGLFPDLLNIRKFYVPGFSSPTSPCSPEIMDKNRYLSPFRSGKPRIYTINGLNIYTSKTWATFNIDTDFWEDDFDDKPRNHNLIVWPAVFTEDSYAKVRYTKIVEPMAADTDEPLVPYANRPVLVYGPLDEYFVQNRDIATAREWRDKHKQLLKEMESDVESVDDELIMRIDRSMNRRGNIAVWFDEEDF